MDSNCTNSDTTQNIPFPDRKHMLHHRRRGNLQQSCTGSTHMEPVVARSSCRSLHNHLFHIRSLEQYATQDATKIDTVDVRVRSLVVGIPHCYVVQEIVCEKGDCE